MSPAAREAPASVLEVSDLTVTYAALSGDVRAVDGVSFTVEAGRSLGIVGESGCGKSTIAKAILGILPDGARTTGRIEHAGKNLLALSAEALNRIRGRSIALVPQSAMHALDPVYTVRRQIAETIEAHVGGTRGDVDRRIGELMRLVGISEARAGDYPHQLSGGQRQRVMIAMALALDPELIVADEPTTGLDVIVQDQIMARLEEIQRSLNKAMVLITHDIALVAESCDRVVVMYAGRIVETGETALLDAPSHPYTMGLMSAFPDLEATQRELITIAGSPPSLHAPPAGCPFHARCPFVLERCRTVAPVPAETMPGRLAACHRLGEAEALRERARLSQTWRQGLA